MENAIAVLVFGFVIALLASKSNYHCAECGKKERGYGKGWKSLHLCSACHLNKVISGE